MRSKTVRWLSLILPVAMLIAAAPALAHGWEKGRVEGDPARMEEFGQGRLERMTVFLDLTDQQVEQWKGALAARGETRRGDRDEAHALHQEIRAMASATNPDPAAVGELVIEAHRLMAAAQAEREAFHAELLSILTPEQQERFEAMRELRPERGARGHRGPRDRAGRRGWRHADPGQGSG